jgi:quinohemoprotein amine dehydrogenase
MTSRFRKNTGQLAGGLVSAIVFAGVVLAQAQPPAEHEEGIPVTDPVVIAKCASCHPRDERGNMQRISWERTTPEGWQAALRRMVLGNGVSLTPAEARSIVKYLSGQHGLAPEEAKAVRYEAERRIHEEPHAPNGCTKCHAFARPLSWRRSLEDWKQVASQHAAQQKFPLSEENVAFLAKAAPLHTPEWGAWSARNPSASKLGGRWLVTASSPGRGKYYGEMQMDATGEGEFNTSVHLTSVSDGSTILRSGRCVVYGGYAWRGRSKGSEAPGSVPGDPLSEAREAMLMAPDQTTGDGRWFWGEYQEFGFDVTIRRSSSETTLLLVDRASLKIGSQGNRIRLIADHVPDKVTPADLHFGAGVSVRGIVSRTPSEIVAEVDVASDAAPGKRDVGLGSSAMAGAIAIYDRVDYIKVVPDSALAAFGDRTHGRGYQQFEAIGYQRGPDGLAHTDDDVELGPVDVTWSLEVFYAAEGASSDHVGKVSPTGLFTPAAANPNLNFDVWAVGTAKNETGKNGKPLVGKCYLVVTVPTYTFNGRKYVRDLDRWVDDGPSQ